jgi:hypothetical protein
MRSLALAGIVSALGGVPAHAQSSAAAQQPQVTQAITVVAKREAVITVLAPRETPSAPATPRRQGPAGIGKAVDADGDGIADAPAGRNAATARLTNKRAAVAAPAKHCDDKDASTVKPACVRNSPQPQDKATQGRNPLHEP